MRWEHCRADGGMITREASRRKEEAEECFGSRGLTLGLLGVFVDSASRAYSR